MVYENIAAPEIASEARPTVLFLKQMLVIDK